MKYALAALILVSTVSVALFAFGAMQHTNHNYYGCVAATAQGAVCPEGASPLDFISFHVGAFQSFSLGVVHDAAAAFAALFLFMLASVVLFASDSRSPMPPPRYANVHVGLAEFLNIKKFTRFLALYERAPAVLAF